MRIRWATQADRGDTLIEVLLAMAILSGMIVGAVTIMSRGLLASQLAIEHTQVRNSINAQSEMLRYLRDSYVSDPTSPGGREWDRLLSASNNPLYVSSAPTTYDTNCRPVKQRPFYLTKNLANNDPVRVTDFNINNAPTTVAEPGRGLWIEAVSSTNAPRYIDFQIRACWQGITGQAPQQSGTVVRLYEAR